TRRCEHKNTREQAEASGHGPAILAAVSGPDLTAPPLLGLPNACEAARMSPAAGTGELMLPTFVIGLREGVEAALIVGIIAAFLCTHGRRDALRWVWTGVALAAGLCLAFGVGLRAVEGTLDQRQQESLETAVALVAVCMVSYMIVWMRRHA